MAKMDNHPTPKMYNPIENGANPPFSGRVGGPGGTIASGQYQPLVTANLPKNANISPSRIKNLDNHSCTVLNGGAA